MEKSELLVRLGKATDRAASLVVQRGSPVSLSKKSILVGSVFIEKDTNGYNVITPDKTKLYENIVVFDVALIIAQRYNVGDTSSIRQVLSLEDKFSKHHTDMIHYLHCIKGAKKKNDKERMAILEDKFQVSELLAKGIRDKITSFKRVK